MSTPSTNTATSSSDSNAFEDLFAFALTLIGRFYVELIVLGGPAAAAGWLWHSSRRPAACVLAAVALVVMVGPCRPMLGRLLHRRSVRRQLNAAFRNIGGNLSNKPPTIKRITGTHAGDRAQLSLKAGTSVPEFERNVEVIATALGARSVRVVPDRRNASRADLVIVYADPFATVHDDFPLANARSFDVWAPIPVGVDDDGETVALSLVEHSMLIGGEPGGGKSVGLSILVSAFALDPSTSLWLFDGKLVELAAWADSAHRSVGTDINDAITALEELVGVMNARYRTLLERRVRKISRGDGLGLHVVVIDELALYVSGVDKKLSAQFCELLRDLVARGRAAGVIVIAATQKPGTDVVPSSLRDLFGYRWAFRCATRDASDTIMGAGQAAAGYNAATIDPAGRGVGLLLSEGGVPRRLRSYLIDDNTLNKIADTAARGRQNR